MAKYYSSPAHPNAYSNAYSNSFANPGGIAGWLAGRVALCDVCISNSVTGLNACARPFPDGCAFAHSHYFTTR